jgi:hypothetical protein
MTRRIPPPAGAGWTAEHLVSTSVRARDGAAIPCEKLIDPLLKERRVGRVGPKAKRRPEHLELRLRQHEQQQRRWRRRSRRRRAGSSGGVRRAEV